MHREFAHDPRPRHPLVDRFGERRRRTALGPQLSGAVTQIDGTSRVHTVSAEQNGYLYRFLEAFERRSGVPVLINTSSNLRGKPIVSSPSDALKTPFASGIDSLAIEEFLVEKAVR